jgi:dinuclear metal center YbgI/SA1388 family protein
MVYLNKITNFLNKMLRIEEYPQDSSQNGLQVESENKEIKKVALAVDSHAKVFEKAKDYDLLIVHHGMFWKDSPLITGLVKKRLKILFDNDTALYACHLPLDSHETYGNNAELVRLLKANILFKWDVGFKAELSKEKTPFEIKQILDKELNTDCKIYNNQNQLIKKFLVISGWGSKDIARIDDYSIKLFITGEVSHPFNMDAFEKDVCVISAGHYASETLGVKAIGKKLKELYPELQIDFIDLPTGL